MTVPYVNQAEGETSAFFCNNDGVLILSGGLLCFSLYRTVQHGSLKKERR